MSIELHFFLLLSLEKRVSICQIMDTFFEIVKSQRDTNIDAVLAILHLLGLYREYNLIRKNMIRM